MMYEMLIFYFVELFLSQKIVTFSKRFTQMPAESKSWIQQLSWIIIIIIIIIIRNIVIIP